jgi:NAD(P)H-hydrate epimerase
MTPFALSRDEVRELDRRAIQEYGVPGVVLMENAGRGAAELLLRLNPERERVLILCGPGNNGGDGFVIARHLQNAGVDVDVWLSAPTKPAPDGTIRIGFHPQLSADCEANHEIWVRSGNFVVNIATDDPRLPRSDLSDQLTLDSGWIVDAIFGTGLTRALTSPYDEVVAAANASGRPVLAVDIPSGLDCDSGEPLGPTIKAMHTATFVALKKGFLNPKAKPWLGEVHVIDIGAPKNLVDEYRAKSLTG